MDSMAIKVLHLALVDNHRPFGSTPSIMNARTRPDPFSLAHMGVKACSCGNPTVEDHDFCFCSPECARADTMLALQGVDCHYRKVVRKAYVRCGAPAPPIYRRKSEEKLRLFSITKKNVSAIIPCVPRPPKPTYERNKPNMRGQDDGATQKEKVFPTLAQVTSAVLARKAKQDPVVGTSMKTSPVTVQLSLPLPPHPPIQKTRPGIGRGAHKSPLTQLRTAPQQTMPLKVDNKTVAIRRQPSLFHAVAEETGRENADDAPLPRKLDRRREERPMPPRPQHPVLPNPIVAARPSGSIRRSASFAGWNSPAEHRDRVAEEGESLMELFDQLEDVRSWIEGWDGTPDLREKSNGA